jgi:hypothetical protein
MEGASFSVVLKSIFLDLLREMLFVSKKLLRVSFWLVFILEMLNLPGENKLFLLLELLLNLTEVFERNSEVSLSLESAW